MSTVKKGPFYQNRCCNEGLLNDKLTRQAPIGAALALSTHYLDPYKMLPGTIEVTLPLNPETIISSDGNHKAAILTCTVHAFLVLGISQIHVQRKNI